MLLLRHHSAVTITDELLSLLVKSELLRWRDRNRDLLAEVMTEASIERRPLGGQMSQSRDAMIEELKRVVVPVLRSLGFKGSFPHFRRAADTQIDLLTFQFSMGGGKFVIEIGTFPPSGYELRGKLIPAAEVKIGHLMRRLRLGAKDESSDHWFHYDGGDDAAVSESVIPYIRGQATEWWELGVAG